MWTACNALSDFGKLHRLPITRDHTILGILSQSEVIQWIHPYIEMNDNLGNKSVQEAGFVHNKEVVSINKSRPVKEAFQLILQHKVSGIAVTGDIDQLYGNISATDFNEIGRDEHFLETLNQPIEKFMKVIPPNPVFGLNPIFTTPTETILVLVRKFAATHVHRIYVVHNAMRICGIISLIDLIKYLIHEAVPKIPLN